MDRMDAPGCSESPHATQERSGACCPYINLEDPRCARWHTIDFLEHALDHCAGNYRACAIYQSFHEARIPITIHGRGARFSVSGLQTAPR